MQIIQIIAPVHCHIVNGELVMTDVHLSNHLLRASRPAQIPVAPKPAECHFVAIVATSWPAFEADAGALEQADRY